ncbi:MAG: leucine-rich repeat domain-containing protein [Clostridiales bacterium]|nr:leucine-rich repeat domain-containing protein [Clostridiales bacterium]
MFHSNPQFPKQNLDILWQPVGEGTENVRILRVYGEQPCLQLPEKIENRPVTEIGAYCFFRSEPKIQGEYFHFLMNQKEDKISGAPLSPISGSSVDALFLPSSVTTLHNAAFYNCRKLHTLSVGANIRSIGSDEFTNCPKLSQMIFRGKDTESTGLPILLERLPDDLNVLILPETEVQSALFFPEYYEWMDEISPAHIFSRSIHGEGFRMRKCFENNHIDYNKYDRCFENALKGESDQTLCRIALNRLLWPEGLSDGFHDIYEQTLRERLDTVVSMAVQDRDLSLLTFLCQYFSNATDYTNAIQCCLDADWGEGGAQLMEEKHRRDTRPSFSQKSFTFDEW